MGYLVSIDMSLIDTSIDFYVGQNVEHMRSILKLHEKINYLEISSKSTLSAIYLLSILSHFQWLSSVAQFYF